MKGVKREGDEREGMRGGRMGRGRRDEGGEEGRRKGMESGGKVRGTC